MPNIAGGCLIANTMMTKGFYGSIIKAGTDAAFIQGNVIQQNCDIGFKIDASKSSSTYQNNAKVNPDNAEIMYCIKY